MTSGTSLAVETRAGEPEAAGMAQNGDARAEGGQAISAAQELSDDLPDLELLRTLRLEGDTSEKEPVYLLVADNGIHVKLSETAHTVLDGLLGGDSISTLAQRLSETRGHDVTIKDTRAACQAVASRVADIADRESKGLPRFFWMRIKLFPKAIVEKQASRLAALFGWRAAAIQLLLITVGLVAAWSAGPAFELSHQGFFPAYALFLLSLIVHEFGHASACARFGAAPSDIGFTMYLIYPAFYSDVTAAWQLGRWQRVAVDLGGVYFQFAVAAVYVLAFQLTGWEPLWMAFGLILYGTLFSLNPIFKFDGYWMLADMLGVMNLGRQPARIIGTLVQRLRGRPTKELPWPPQVILILAVYSVLSIAVWGFFIYLLTPFLTASLAEIPSQAVAIFRALFVEPGWPSWPSVRALLVSLMLWVFAALMVWRLFGKLVTPILRSSSRKSEGP